MPTTQPATPPTVNVCSKCSLPIELKQVGKSWTTDEPVMRWCAPDAVPPINCITGYHTPRP